MVNCDGIMVMRLCEGIMCFTFQLEMDGREVQNNLPGWRVSDCELEDRLRCNYSVNRCEDLTPDVGRRHGWTST